VFEAKSMIDSDPSLVILDVRTQSEYDSGHIRNAKLIPSTELEGRLNELNKTDKILVYCGSGTRSATASQILADNGFLYIYNMLWGLTYWKLQGYPVYVKYSSIQQAINGASEGQSLYVSSGTYLEHVVVNKALSLIGEDRNSVVIDGSGSGTVVSIENDNVRITGLTIRNSGSLNTGIRMSGLSNCSILNNDILNNFFGIVSYSCSNTIISVNNIENGYYGIELHLSNHNRISGNRIMSTEWAIISSNSSSNSIYENYEATNLWGISFSYSMNNLVYKNNFSENTAEAIQLGRSSNNSIYENNFEKNEVAIWLSESGNNTFCHNNLMNNTRQFDFLVASFSNAWNNTCEGNYWSDYTGSDSNHDGIGDTSYIVGSNNTDYYPLMNPYWIPADVNHDLKVDILDVVKITGCYATTPSDPDYNPHADIAAPYGKIDILDVVLSTGHYAEKYP